MTWLLLLAAGSGKVGFDELAATIYAALLYAVIAGVPTSLVFGWPLHALLLRRGISQAPVYATLGGALALLAWFITWTLGLVPFLFSFLFFLLAPFVAVVAGIVAGFVFWLIRRPDLDVRTPESAP